MKRSVFALALLVGTGSLGLEREAAAFEFRKLIPRYIKDKFRTLRQGRLGAEISLWRVFSTRTAERGPVELPGDRRPVEAKKDKAAPSLSALVLKANEAVRLAKEERRLAKEARDQRQRKLERFMRDVEPLHDAVGAAMDLIGTNTLNLRKYTRTIPLIFKRDKGKISVFFAEKRSYYGTEAVKLDPKELEKYELTVDKVSAVLKKTIVRALGPRAAEQTSSDDLSGAESMEKLVQRAREVSKRRAEADAKAEQAQRRAVETFVDGLKPLHEAIGAAMDLTRSDELNLFEHARSVPLIFRRDEGKISVFYADYVSYDGTTATTIEPDRFEWYGLDKLTVDQVSAGLKQTLVNLMGPAAE